MGKSEDKKSFQLYNDYIDHFSLMSDEEAGKLIKAIFCYVNDLPCEELAGLPDEIVNGTAEQHTPCISQAPYLRKTAMAVSVEVCGRFSLPMPDTAAAVLDGMDCHIPPGVDRKSLDVIRELSVTIGVTVE